MGDFYLEDFIEDYDDQNYENIQLKTTERNEFFQLRSSNKKTEEYKGRFFKHQKLIKRYAIQYNRIFNIHETGTGKTASIINLAEYYKNSNKIKRVYVLQPGPPTVDDFLSQIRKFTFDNKQNLFSDLSENKVTREIREFYEVTTYQKFLKDDLSDEDIEKYYSDCIFFFDEAHKLRNLSDNKGGSLTDTQIKKIYDYLWRLTHIVKRSKVIIASATPMINNVKDFVPLLNLLLPEDRQFPEIKNDKIYDTLNIDQVEPYFRGLFSYVRFLQEDIKVIDKGIELKNLQHTIYVSKNKKNIELKPEVKKIKDKQIITVSKSKVNIDNEVITKKINSSLKIYPLEMKSTQRKAYTDHKIGKDPDSFHLNTSQISLFVYPNGSYGNKGFKLYVGENEFKRYYLKDNIFYKNKEITSINQFISPENLEASLNNLSSLSNKFHFFIKKEIEKSNNERPGNSFCYLDQVEGSGVIILGLILERLGFEEFTSNNSGVINPKTEKIQAEFKKKKRFSLITGKTPNLRNILRVYNNPDNLDGEYIQILIVSEVARDGINIKNVRRGYIMTPGWHESGMHQALSRFVRADSHDNLINRNIREGKNPSVSVEIYRLASILTKENLTNEKNMTTDMIKYVNSELKDIKIKRVLRLMKICAFDAYLNYSRNFKKTDVSFTKESDYSESLPTLLNPLNIKFKSKNGLAMGQGPGEEDLIFNTYNLYYLKKDDYYNRESGEITRILSNKPIISLEEISNYINKKFKTNKTYKFYELVERLTSSDFSTINDDLNTDKRYFQKKGDILYLTSKNYNPSNKNIWTEGYYSFTDQGSYQEKIILDVEPEKLEKLYEKLKGKNKESIINIYSIVQNHIDYKYLLEDSLIRNKFEKLNNTNINILELFRNYWLELKIPEGWLEITKGKLSEVVEKKQGRKREEGSKAGLKDLDLTKYPKKESNKTIYIHFYRESDKTGFNITSILEGKFRKIRILYDKEFRDTDMVEEFVYTKIFDIEYDKILEKFKKSKYYGSYIYRGGNIDDPLYKRKKEFFRIIDTSNPRNKGRVCINNKGEDIVKVLKFLDTDKKYKKYYTQTNKKEAICNIVKDLFSEKNLLFSSM